MTDRFFHLAFKTMKSFFVLCILFIVSMGDVTFTPAKLPCAFTIKTEIERTLEGSKEGTVSVQEDYHYHGGLFHLISNIENTSRSDILVRPDIIFKEKKQEYVPIFDAMPKQKCQYIKSLKSDIENYEMNWLGVFMQKQTFDTVSESTFKGKKCKMYYSETETTLKFLYVDDNDYVIGSWHSNGHKTEATSMYYIFNAPLEEFAMNRTMYSDCDQKAYSIPKEQC